MTTPTSVGLGAFGLTLTAAAIATLARCDANSDYGAATPVATSATTQDPAPNAPATPPPDALRLLISGGMLGKLEPCGCASGQLGGLARRVQHIGEQRNYDLLIEGGDLVDGDSELDRLKLFTTATVLFQMEHTYDVLGVGSNDVAMNFDEWSAYLTGAPVVASNISSENPAWPGQPFVDKEVRGRTVRIASLLLDELPGAARKAPASLRRSDPASAWRDAFEGAPDDTVRIALLHGGDVAFRALIPKLEPRPDLVIGVDQNYIEPEATPSPVAGVPLVFAGIRGRVLLDARLWRHDGQPRVALERVPLTGSRTVPGGGGDPSVKDVILRHRHDVAEFDLLTSMAGKHPTPNGDSFVGSATCAGCHPSAMQAWQKSRHAHAWQTLVDAEKDPKRYGWPVTRYPECVACHVVGYEMRTGFVSHDATPQLEDVGCEQCHGPGSGHVQAAGKKPLGMREGLLPSQLCVTCHDFEQTPDFHYLKYWQQIEHGREPQQQKR